MKFANAAALLLLLTTPALADATKTIGGVVLECTVTGSGKDGFDVTADNKKGSPTGIAVQPASSPKRTDQRSKRAIRKKPARTSRSGWAAKAAFERDL